MSLKEPRCEGCGSTLVSADAVCARCEAELTAEPSRPPAKNGKYICPHCQQRFAAPARVFWPPKLPWWRPTTIRQQCPHCDVPLRDRREPPYLSWIGLPLLVLILYLPEFAGLHQTLVKLALALLVASYAWQVWIDWKGARDPHRFIVGIRRLWLRQPKDLSAPRPHRPE